MKIVWDEPKRLANITKHGFDFADIGDFNWASSMVVESQADEPNRRCFKAVGYFRDGTLPLSFSRR